MSQDHKIYLKEICAIADLKAPMKISPIGNVTGIDGRVFAIDGEAVLADLEKNNLKIVLNVNHGEDDKYGAEAAGWFSDFKLKKKGIYASLNLNKLGQSLLDAQAYKYLSPEYLTDEFRNVASIVGVGLVNQPNLLNQALNTLQPSDNTTGDETMKPEKDSAKDSNAELMKLKEDNRILQEKITSQDEVLRTQKIDNAIFKGKLIPAKKEFALALDVNSLDSFLAMEAENTDLKKEDNKLNPDALDDEDAGNAIYQQLGL